MSASRTDEPDARAPSQGPVGTGRCGVCGHEGEYVVTGAPTRESHECAGCRASLRYRLQAAAIAAIYGHPEASLAELVTARPFSSFALYEPGTIGPFRRVLRDLRGYVNSYFWPEVPLGEERDGVRCEDLRALTFGDEAFDLVISSDILEHVRGPMEAFAEIHRVLRPGGVHVFTVPLNWPLPAITEARVDYSGPEDRFLAPPVYHGSPHDPNGSLVYTDFGMDLPELVREIGFRTITYHDYMHAVTFVSRKTAG
jgi:SAM-dependent methyltransferase